MDSFIGIIIGVLIGSTIGSVLGYYVLKYVIKRDKRDIARLLRNGLLENKDVIIGFIKEIKK